MSAEIIEFTGVTKLDLPVERILQKSLERDLEGVVVIGWDKEGDMYFSSSYADGPEVLWLLAMAQRNLLNVGSGEEDE